MKPRFIVGAGCLAVAALACGAAWAAPAGAAATGYTGDAVRGQSVYERCLACHAIAYDRTGPRHCGLFGRRAGSVPGFAYSDAMKRSGIVWNEQTLDVFLKSPMTAVPGTSMGYAGVADPQERADLIAYLKQAPACAPQ